ncbi:MAG: gamma-glutamyltransferase [Nocardioides sp.]|nr:gamma-glutamyltransferase [Nocardioides sp.]
MVASTHWLASASAMAVLERGGNAADAAVAGGLVLQVVEPHLNGPGGDMALLLATAADPAPRALSGIGPAPAAASIEAFTERGLDLVPGAGALAAAVPGQMDAWWVLLRDEGTWEPADVAAYALHYATRGFPALPSIRRTLATVERLFVEHWPASAAQWLLGPSGGVPAEGALLTNPTWAHTLERLLAAAPTGGTREARIDAVRRAWGDGFVAEAVERAAAVPHRHSDGGTHAGLLAAADLAAFSAAFEPAVVRGFRGHQVAKCGPWTQGPALLQALGMLERYDDVQLDLRDPAAVHRVVETVALVMADRDAWLGDRDDVPLAALLDPAYLADRAALVTEGASLAFRPGEPAGRPGFQPPLLLADEAPGDVAAGEPTVRRTGAAAGDTCHLDVVDRWGTMISATPSGGWLQSSPYLAEVGFALGTRLQQCWLDPAAPSGLLPGRRPRMTLSPTLVLREDRPVAALGTPGGDDQDQWQLLYLLRTLAGSMSPQQAIDAPMLSSSSFPNSFWPRAWNPGGLLVEDRFGSAVIDDLARRGHRVMAAGSWTLGRLSAVTRDPATGRLGAAANPRGMQGYAVGR